MDNAFLSLILLSLGSHHADAMAPAPAPTVISEPSEQPQIADDGLTTQEICIVLGDKEFPTRMTPSKSADPLSPSNWAV
ncbi:hypothetical protein [Streptomyces sp. NBRC 109706]|uniref:hypothetical protein n=1 Tax=Streptomyces sp. NBRC 109706 TaxID=1550035 RepID=UPI000782EC26|nr:hypothetical protein [Streptomyces sp. NBRC 109706]